MSDDSNDSNSNGANSTIREAFDRTLTCSTPTKDRSRDSEADLAIRKVDGISLNSTISDKDVTVIEKSASLSSSVGSSNSQRGTVVQANPTSFSGSSVHLVRVRVEERLLSIPLPKDFSSLTIAYLEQQAAERYLTIEGTKPVVNIALEDGALLCSSDPIECVRGVPVLKAVIVSWNVPPLEERYRSRIGEGRHLDKRILYRCQQATALGKLELDHIRIPAELLVVLKHEVHLHTLQLSFVHLDPNALLALAEVLSRLQNLSVLRLAGCNLRGKQLCDLLGKFGSRDLGELDLSFNLVDHYFGNLMDATLRKLVPSLHTMRLSSCGIQVAGLLSGLRHFPLTSLDLSCNALEADAVDAVLQLLDSCPLKQLDLSNSLGELSAQRLVDILRKCTKLTRLKVNGLDLKPGLPPLAVDMAECRNPDLELHIKGSPSMQGRMLATLEDAFRKVVIA